MSKLPEYLEEETIGGMPVGEFGWAVPWAMYPIKDRSLWINAHYFISDTPGGTVQMLVQRTTDGVRVWESTIGENRYSTDPAREYGNLWTDDDLPVTLVQDEIPLNVVRAAQIAQSVRPLNDLENIAQQIGRAKTEGNIMFLGGIAVGITIITVLNLL